MDGLDTTPINPRRRKKCSCSINPLPSQKSSERSALMASNMFSLPVIDLANYLPPEKKKLTAAVTELGCFRVVNHGFPEALRAEIRATTRSLMELPDEVKLRNTHITPYSGYLVNNRSEKIETFGIYDGALLEDVNAFCSLIEVSPIQREIICKYASKIHRLTMDVASKVADCLGVTEYSFEDWCCHIRMNRYNFSPECVVGSTGLGVHTDSGFITAILEDDSIGGFEFMGPTGDYVPIEPVSNTILFVVGDMGQVWSNGRLHNVKHRVMCCKGLQRFSIIFNLYAPKDGSVEPQKEFIDLEHPRLYNAISFKKYREDNLIYNSYAGELLPSYQIISTTPASITK